MAEPLTDQDVAMERISLERELALKAGKVGGSERKVALIKWAIGTAGLAFVTTVGGFIIQGWGIGVEKEQTARELGIQERQMQLDYLNAFTGIAIDDDILKRIRFAHYVASTIDAKLFEELQKQWNDYYLELVALCSEIYGGDAVDTNEEGAELSAFCSVGGDAPLALPTGAGPFFADPQGDLADRLDALLGIAEGELGVAEIPGAEHNLRIVEYHSTTTLAAQDDETPWTSSFINWVVQQAGYQGTNSAAARSWESWGAEAYAIGCIAVLWSQSPSSSAGHVGIVVNADYSSGQITLLGGNQGNQVSVTAYSADRLLSCRVPSDTDGG